MLRILRRSVPTFLVPLLLLLGACATPTATATPTPTPAPVAPTTTPPATGPATGVALWPFVSATEVAAWQKQYRDGGAQPWHLDAADTALSFTQGFLGYADLDQVTSQEGNATEAWVGVGYQVPGAGTTSTAAVLHLARFGTGADAPWVVVGTRDTTLTLDRPGYGSAATWPLEVGGVLSGVDESLHVRALTAAGDVVGDACCQPAGGQDTPWKDSVRKQGSPSGPLTVVVATGGHVVDVERFAITAITT